MSIKDPILATRQPKGPDGYTVYAVGGLHYLRGNPLPYFAVTQEAPRTSNESCGAALDEIAEHWPHLKPLTDLHLSDMNGVPMHAEANGWYWLAGSVVGGFGQQFHGGSGSSAVDAAECLRRFASTVRVSHQAAADLREHILEMAKAFGNKAARQEFAAWIEDQKPRWKAEADACIKNLSLQVYGDPWKQEAAAA